MGRAKTWNGTLCIDRGPLKKKKILAAKIHSVYRSNLNVSTVKFLSVFNISLKRNDAPLTDNEKMMVLNIIITFLCPDP